MYNFISYWCCIYSIGQKTWLCTKLNTETWDAALCNQSIIDMRLSIRFLNWSPCTYSWTGILPIHFRSLASCTRRSIGQKNSTPSTLSALAWLTCTWVYDKNKKKKRFEWISINSKILRWLGNKINIKERHKFQIIYLIQILSRILILRDDISQLLIKK